MNTANKCISWIPVKGVPLVWACGIRCAAEPASPVARAAKALVTGVVATGSYHVEIRAKKNPICKASAQFFLDWV